MTNRNTSNALELFIISCAIIDDQSVLDVSIERILNALTTPSGEIETEVANNLASLAYQEISDAAENDIRRVLLNRACKALNIDVNEKNLSTFGQNWKCATTETPAETRAPHPENETVRPHLERLVAVHQSLFPGPKEDTIKILLASTDQSYSKPHATWLAISILENIRGNISSIDLNPNSYHGRAMEDQMAKFGEQPQLKRILGLKQGWDLELMEDKFHATNEYRRAALVDIAKNVQYLHAMMTIDEKLDLGLETRQLAIECGIIEPAAKEWVLTKKWEAPAIRLAAAA